MSSRALRKLQEKTEAAEAEDEPSEEEFRDNTKQKGFNAFLLLNESCSESEVKEDDDLESCKDPPKVVQAEKKKRKRKKKTGKKLAVASSEDNIDLKADHDDIDETVRWVEANEAPAVKATSLLNKEDTEVATVAARKVLLVENKHLNPENEMKRIFGSRVVASENTRHKKGRGGRGGHQVHHRATLLVTPKPTWPSGARTGLSMRPVESEAPGSWFTYDHSPTYQQVQMAFLSAVESLNPDSIVAILNNHPMHIDSLLQLSDICKMGDDSAMAAEMVERALYALESAFHPCFNLASGECHLDYRRQENRAIFIALFRHLHNVGARACYRTALEVCKVLLNLDPADPLAIVLTIDFYALRARSDRWLVDFYTAANPARNLDQLPNFAYSVALATFHLSQEPGGAELEARADHLLQEALISFPSVLLDLLDKCSIEPDPAVTACSYFLDTRAEPASLGALVSLYTARSYHCWKEPELLPWLERNVRRVVARVQAGDARAEESRAARRTRYQGKLPRNIHRHLVMADSNKEALAHLPADMKDVHLLAWDPLPPHNSINTYVAPERQTTVIDDPSALRMFFRSLLPNFNPADPLPAGAAAAAEEGAGAAGGGAGGELRHSVHNLLDAMRDLLGNIQLPEHPAEGGDEASEDEDRDPAEWD